MASPSYQDTQAGTEIAPKRYQVTRRDLVKYAGASGDFNVIHWNERIAKSVGLPDVIAHGMLTMALAGRFLTDWAGPEAMIRRLSIRLGVPVFPGSTLTFTGTVTATSREGNEGTVDVGFRATNELGDHLTGTAMLTLPVRDGRG